MTTFFFDNNLSPRYVAALSALGRDVVHVRKVFGERGNARDEDWMPDVAARGWLAITQDRHILSNPHQREVLRACGLRMFFLPRAFIKMGFWDQGVFLVTRWNSIEGAAVKAQRGQLHEIQQNGRVVLV